MKSPEATPATSVKETEANVQEANCFIIFVTEDGIIESKIGLPEEG